VRAQPKSHSSKTNALKTTAPQKAYSSKKTYATKNDRDTRTAAPDARSTRFKRRHPEAPRQREPREHRPPAFTDKALSKPPVAVVRTPPPAPPLPQAASGVQTVAVTPDENGMRVDRFLEARFPGLSFSHIQRVIRKGELRVNGKRVDGKDRLAAGQAVRIPPLKLDPPKREGSEADEQTRTFLKSIILHEDDDVLVLNKPMGLAVQGGSGTVKHVDGMLDVLKQRDGQRPRLVHRLDKDTAGCLLVAKTRFAAAALAKTFRTRSAKKIYWALVAGVPKPKQGRISTFLAKEERDDESFMRIAKHGEEGASHAITYYALVEPSAQKLAWISLKPVTGRTHQLRAHMAHIGHPIVGDAKYFARENWELPGGMQNRLHLLARRLVAPHPRGGVIDVTAPLPPHMQQSWNLLGLDAARYDPIVEAPEE
jgi:23S rRNA pseudouridine955/2504/2580 synthase